MGGVISSGVADVKSEVKTQVHTQMMIQREVQMAVNVAKARDSLQWYGGLYTGGVTVITAAKMAGKAVPHVAGIPLVVGGFMLANMADAAYGNKLMRVQREAEHIIAEERALFVPPKQAPFSYLYSEEQDLVSGISAVSTLWPSFLPMSRPQTTLPAEETATATA